MAGPDAHPFRGGENFHGGPQPRQIGQRFPHAHKDKVFGATAGDFGGPQHLPDNFCCGEIAAPAVESAGAEAAAIRTTDLAGDAEGKAAAAVAVPSWIGRNQDRLEEGTIPQPPEKFAGGIGGTLNFDRLDRSQTELSGQFGPKARRQVRHFFKRGGEPLEDPFPNLFFPPRLGGGQLPIRRRHIEEKGLSRIHGFSSFDL